MNLGPQSQRLMSSLVWSGLVQSGTVLSGLVWSGQLDVSQSVSRLVGNRGDTNTMTLSEDKGHGKNKLNLNKQTINT